MNERFAVDPSAFRDARDVAFLLQKFGFHEGRFLAALPSGWLKEFYRTLDQFPDGPAKLSSKRLVERLQEGGGLVRSGATFSPGPPWVDSAVQAASLFAGIVGREGETLKHPAFRTIDAATFDDEFFGNCREAEHESSIEGYLRVASRLLDVGPEIYLVDPYFSFEKRKNTEVFAAMVDVGLKGRSRSFVVYAHEKHNDVSNLDDAVGRFLESVKHPGLTLRCLLICDDESASKAHARYLLSKHGGLRFDYGFQIQHSREKKRHDVLAIDRGRHEQLCAQFLDGKNDFKVVKEVIRRS